MLREPSPLQTGFTPISIDPYLPLHQAANFMGYMPALLMNSWPWNSPLPTSWIGNSLRSTAQDTEPPFHFDQQTFGDAIRDAGENPWFY